MSAMAAMVALSVWPPAAVANTTLTVTTFADDLDPGAPCVVDDCTLRAAVAHANPGDEIVLQSGTYLLDDQIALPIGVTIRGQGMNSTMITPSVGGHRLFDIPPGTIGHVTFQDLRLHNGDGTGADDSGAAIRLAGTDGLTIRQVYFSDNAAPEGAGARGGALFVTDSSGPILIQSSIFRGNTAAYGGAMSIRESNSVLQIIDTAFDANRAIGPGGPVGGAIHVVNSDGLEVVRSSFTSNQAIGGGAVSVSGGSTVAIRQSRFDGNSATLLGGAIHAADGASMTILNTTLTSNTAMSGSVAGTDTGAEVSFAFATIINHATGFSASGGSTIDVTYSALSSVAGCGDITDRTGSFADGASDAACGHVHTADLHLIDDIAPPNVWPAALSPLVGAVTSSCPSVDQRGVARTTPCAAGAIDPAGIVCPSGTLVRGEPITCALDVALHGPLVAVHAQHNPVVFDDTVAINAGAGDFTFTLSPTDPSIQLVIAVAGGLYSATLPVEPLGGGGGGGGSGGSGGGTGGSGNSGTGSSTSDDSDGGASSLNDAEPAAERAPRPQQLAFTGRSIWPGLLIGITMLVIGCIQFGTAVRASRRVRCGS